MSLDEFYKIDHVESEEGKIIARIKLNPDHQIYEGHFPEQPVVPGVTQLQVLKDILENQTSSKLVLSQMTFAKYLFPILPHESSDLIVQVDFSFSENAFKVNAVIKDKDQIFTKFKALFKIS